LAIDLDLAARPFAEQHEIAGFDFGRNALAMVVERARADGDDLAFVRLLLDGVGNDDATGGFLIFGDSANDHTVAQWAKLHGYLSRLSDKHPCLGRIAKGGTHA